MRKYLTVLIAFVLILSMTSCGVSKENSTTSTAGPQHSVPLNDYVLDIGTITEFDEQAILDACKDKYLVSNGGCSSILTQADGNNLVGRNMDLTLSENAAFKFVLDINKYKVIGLVYPTIKGLGFDTTYDNG